MVATVNLSKCNDFNLTKSNVGMSKCATSLLIWVKEKIDKDTCSLFPYLDADDLLILDKYVIDKELQHTDDFILYRMYIFLPFVLWLTKYVNSLPKTIIL